MARLARVLFFTLCLTLLACGHVYNVISVRNETPSPLKYAIGISESNDYDGTLLPGQSYEALRYSSDTVDKVYIYIEQHGKLRYRIFTGKEIPTGHRFTTSGGVKSHISISERAITFHKGTGDLIADITHDYWFVLVLGSVATAISVLRIYKSRSDARKYELSPLDTTFRR